MTVTLGIDIGTYGSKGVLVDGEGRILAEARRGHEMIVPRPGWAEHRAEEDWWHDFIHVCRALIDQSGIRPASIDAVACSAIGPCMLPVDAAGAPLINGVLYGVDTRATAEVDELTRRIGVDMLVETGGAALTSQSVGPKILWLRRHRPELFEKAAKVMTSTSYLVMRLTGEVVIDHYTAVNYSPLYDFGALSWTDALAPGIIETDRLPRLMWSTEIAGHVTAAAAAETGLAEGTPVTAGTVDAAAEAVSVGVAAPGDTMMMYGSTVFMIMLTEARLRDPRLWTAPWLFEGRYAAMAGLATSGTLTHWFRDQFARELARDDAFAALLAEAEASPKGARGLILLPYFSGERTPIHDPLAKGCLMGLNLTHNRGDIYRALLEGIAYGTNHVVETYAEAGTRPAAMRAVGGGVDNTVWMQATSDVTGLDQIVCGKTVGASYGDAYLAALAIGAAQPGDIDRWNPQLRTVSATAREVYARPYALFRRLYEQTRDIAHELDGDRA